MGIETDTNLFKIGDGVTEWTSLAYGGLTGATGADGADGADGVGVPVGGTTGQALIKSSNTDYATEWGTVTTTPAGSDTQVQFNDGGSFGGDSGLTFNKTSKAITLGGATVTTSSPVIDAAQTWNDAGVTFTGLKFNATDTASAAASLLMDLQVGGASRFKVAKSGLATVGSVGFNSTSLIISVPDGGTISYLTSGSNYLINGTASKFALASSIDIAWSSSSQFGYSSLDTFLCRKAAANLRLGAADAAAPVAQTLSVQSVVAGTTNTAGANLTITGSQGTGTGAGGSIIFQVAPAGSSGTAQNALATRLQIVPSASGIEVNNHVYAPSGASLYLGSNGYTFGGQVRLNGSTVSIPAAGTYSWTNDTTSFGTVDTILARDAANTLAQRNGANAQAFRLYNTYTDATTFERANIFWDSNVLKIGTEKGSVGGTARALELQTDGTTRLTISTLGNATVTGWLKSLYFDAPAAALGGNGGIYFGTSVSNGSQVQSTGAGIISLGNYGGTDFNRLNFGGTTSSFPALKRSSASLIVRLADDTANAALESASLKTDAPTGGTAATWKLGTVATVSPTSPDRTIEVDIGGTIYYISAKTTND
jgi:hypothetical protein